METLRYMKKADKEKNRIILPKFIIDKFGKEFYLEVNCETGEMVLKPIKKEKGGK